MQQAASQRPAGPPGLPPRMQAYPVGKAGFPAAYHRPPLLYVRYTRHLAVVMAVTVQASHSAARPLINAAALLSAFARWHAEPPLTRHFSIGYGTPCAHSRRYAQMRMPQQSPVEQCRTV